ncbi:MAG: hypothetical protein J6Y59_08055 [Bacteroidaceae bacterium]|nr:hypothetical protein [Bacteroidaceae bacterium]
MRRKHYQTPRTRILGLSSHVTIMTNSLEEDKTIIFDPEDGTDEALTKQHLTNIWDAEW